jgi:acetyltransferase-like isoleucine patch superfamily enzyme
LPNVTIGRHAIIGANSVVTGDIPPYSVAVGAPARVIERYDFDLKQWVRVDG